MKMQELQKLYPMGLASPAMDLDKFEYLSCYRDNEIRLLELTPMVTNNKAWRAQENASTEGLVLLCEKYKVQPESVHGFYLKEYGHDMADESEEVRNNAISLNKRLISATSKVGARYMVVHLFNEHISRSADETMLIANEALRQLLPEAEKAGIRLAVENLKNDWSIKQINELLDEWQHPLLGICLDTGHAALYGDVSTELELCGDRLLGFHIHDNQGQKDDHMIPFRGKTDWRTFTEGIAKTGYKGPLMFESFNRRENEPVDIFIEACRQAYDRLLNFLSDCL